MSASYMLFSCLLVVANDPPLQQLCTWYLQQRNIAVVAVRAVAEIGVDAHEQRPMFALINDQLPHTDALVVAAKLRTIRPMPMLLLLDTSRPDRAQQAYAFDYRWIAKPFSSDEMHGHLQAIQHLFE